MRPKGDCFVANAKYILNNFVFGKEKFTYKDIFLCHGYVVGSKLYPSVKNKVFVHAWVEIGEIFLDFSNNNQIAMKRSTVYESGRILLNTIIRYTPKKVAEFIKKYEHYGPWDDSFKIEFMTVDKAKHLGLK